MAPTENAGAKTARLEATILPFLRQLLKDAPSYGEISLTIVLHDDDVARVRMGAEVQRLVAPRSSRG